MLLKFYAKADALQRVPDFHPEVDQHDRYVGREHDPQNPGSFPATREPFTCEADSANGQRLKHLIYRDRDLWAADQETADYCQVPFVDVVFQDGEYVPRELAAPASSEGAAPDAGAADASSKPKRSRAQS